MSGTDLYKSWAIRIWWAVGIIVLLGVLFYLLELLKPALVPFIYAIALVYVFRGPVDWLEEKKLPRALAVFTVYLVAFLVILLFFLYFIPLISAEVAEFSKKLPAYVDTVTKWTKIWQERYVHWHIPPRLESVINRGFEGAQNMLIGFLSSLPGLGVSFAAGFFNLIMAPVLAFYILKDFRAIKETFFSLVPSPYRAESRELARRIDHVVKGFISGQVLISFFVAILTGIALAILRVDFAFLIGLLTGVLNIIPYFGPVVGGALAALVAFFKSPWLALWAILAMIIIQQIDAFFISPNVLSYQVRIHPTLVLFALIVGGLWWGILGMIVAIPLVAAGKAILYYFLEERQSSGEKVEK